MTRLKLSSYMPPWLRTASRTPLPDKYRVYAVGDIHGCVRQLDQLHDLILADWQSHCDVQPEGIVVYLGDYIDRGPQSRAVIDCLSAHRDDGLLRIFLKGNHEDMLERFLDDPEAAADWLEYGGLATLLSYGIYPVDNNRPRNVKQLAQQLKLIMPQAHHAFYKNLDMSFSVGGYFFCHAGVRPGVSVDRQTAHDLLWIRNEFVASESDFGKIVVHGHSPVDAPEALFNRINVDTGAYATGRLTCAVLWLDQVAFLSTEQGLTPM